MPEPTGYLPIGERIRELRRRRGLSQGRLGALVDRSENWVSKVERGEIPIDRLSVLIRVAEVLRISPAELIRDEHVMRNEGANPLRQGIAAVRRAILRGPIAPAAQPRDLDALDADLIQINRVWNRTHMTAAVGLLPQLLADLEAAARGYGGDQRDRALRLLGQGYGFASMAMTRLTEHDLALVAVDRSRQIAEQLGDPALQTHATFRLVHVLLGAGQLDEAAAVADAGLARAQPDATLPAVRSLMGAIHLPLAVSAARRSDEATAFAALREASALTKGPSGQVEIPSEIRFWTGFKPVNVTLHHVAVAVDLGNAGEALRVASTVDQSAVRAERRSRFLIDVALAHSYRRETEKMVATLSEVERFAPEQLVNFPLVREMVHAALRRERGPANARLHALALRVGVI